MQNHVRHVIGSGFVVGFLGKVVDGLQLRSQRGKRIISPSQFAREVVEFDAGALAALASLKTNFSPRRDASGAVVDNADLDHAKKRMEAFHFAKRFATQKEDLKQIPEEEKTSFLQAVLLGMEGRVDEINRAALQYEVTRETGYSETSVRLFFDFQRIAPKSNIVLYGECWKFDKKFTAESTYCLEMTGNQKSLQTYPELTPIELTENVIEQLTVNPKFLNDYLQKDGHGTERQHLCGSHFLLRESDEGMVSLRQICDEEGKGLAEVLKTMMTDEETLYLLQNWPTETKFSVAGAVDGSENPCKDMAAVKSEIAASKANDCFKRRAENFSVPESEKVERAIFATWGYIFGKAGVEEKWKTIGADGDVLRVVNYNWAEREQPRAIYYGTPDKIGNFLQECVEGRHGTWGEAIACAALYRGHSVDEEEVVFTTSCATKDGVISAKELRCPVAQPCYYYVKHDYNGSLAMVQPTAEFESEKYPPSLCGRDEVTSLLQQNLSLGPEDADRLTLAKTQMLHMKASVDELYAKEPTAGGLLTWLTNGTLPTLAELKRLCARVSDGHVTKHEQVMTPKGVAEVQYAVNGSDLDISVHFGGVAGKRPLKFRLHPGAPGEQELLSQEDAWVLHSVALNKRNTHIL